jgi:flagellar motor switch protein FliG
MQAMGPVRLKDVEEAQSYLVTLAKDLASRGEIVVSDGGAEDQLVY